MSTRFNRRSNPASYSPTMTTNSTIYNDDSTASPPVAISSTKVDGDLAYVIDSLNLLDDDINAVVAGGLPTQTGNSGKFLTTNGTTASWAAITSAAMSGSNSVLLGTDGSGNGDEISLSSELTLSASTLSVTALGITTAMLADTSVTAAKLGSSAVTTAKINDDAVTLAKMAAGTAGNLITYDASGDPAAVSTGTSGQILTSNGAGAAPTFQTLDAGKIAQVVQTAKTSTFSTTSSSYTDVTGLSVTITPSATSSKIMILAYGMSSSTSNFGNNLQLVRNSTAINIGDASGSADRASSSGLSDASSLNYREMWSIVYVDSPSTTSATTYKIQAKTGGGTMYIGRDAQPTPTAGIGSRVPANIIVLEILA